MLTLVATALARPPVPADSDRLRTVDAPSLSPDGKWVAYEVSTTNPDKDEVTTDLYLVATDGSEHRQLTFDPDSESTPRFSPDGRWIGFLSDRGDDREVDQLWVLSTRGGEARKVTDVPGGVDDFDWAPDSAGLVLVVDDPDPEAVAAATDPDRPPVPLVIDRFWFKDDDSGYLRHFRSHLALTDLAGIVTPLTQGDTDEVLPRFSPDGTRIAFVSKRGSASNDPDRSFDWNVYVMAATPDAPALAVTAQNPGADCDPEVGSRPQWSPDGKSLAVVQSGKPELLYYAPYRVAVVPADGSGPGRVVLADLDRNSWEPRFSPDGKRIWLLVEDDGSQRLGWAPVGGGTFTPVVPADQVVDTFEVVRPARGPDRMVVLAADGTHPMDVRLVDKKGLVPLGNENAALLAELDLVPVKPIAYPSADGTEIHGFVAAPTSGGPHPTFLRLHGGPTSQYDPRFRLEVQVLAGAGYTVLMPDPRGSTGRGLTFATAIWADWGTVDAPDVLGAVDWAVKQGISDPDRLTVGGWSYGGILTDQVIARDGRFKAAFSGAGIGNVLAGYGVDMYVREYEAELGTPWEHPDLYERNSLPFLHADRIHTPTLFMGGLNDFNVPIVGSEQMYQALRSLGVPTELVIYPGQHHGISRPSFVRDRMVRMLDWLGRWTGTASPTTATR